MADSTNTLPQVVASQGADAVVNMMFEAAAPALCFGRDYRTSSGLTFGWLGGRWNSFAISDDSETLSASATHYMVVEIATGAVTFATSTTNWNDTTNYWRAYKIVASAGALTYEDHRGKTVGGGGGGGSGGTELKGLTFTSDTGSTADSDPGAGLFKWNNATEASATFLYFDNTTTDGISLTTFYASLGAAGFIYLQQGDDSTKWQLWKWTATPTNGTGYYKFAVTLQANGGTIADNKTTYADFSGLASAPAWGAITGTLSSQTDLQAALDLKQARTPSIQSVTSSATVTPTFADDMVKITAQAAGLTLANPTGTAIDGLGMVIRIKDNGTARSITFGSQYRAIGVTLPATTVVSKTLYLALVYNAADTKWDVLAVGQEA